VTEELVFATFATSNFLLDFPNCNLGVLPITPTGKKNETKLS